MCTAINLKTENHYFGRNLDLDRSYGEEVCITPRNFALKFRLRDTAKSHYAIIGMATVADGVPLYYDGTNEKGLSMAALNFPNNAHYFEPVKTKDNICHFELISYVLGVCKSTDEASELFKNINIVNLPFNDDLPVSPLHWIISDRHKSIVIESRSDGLHIHENPVEVLTNNPPFEHHISNLNNYRRLSITNGENLFSKSIKLEEYSQGLGAIGLPGDVSSMSRFIRAAFHKENSVCGDDEASSVSQFFHILSSVSVCRGICLVPSGEYSITVYSSCINTDKGLYYYTTYLNSRINCVDMHRVDLDSQNLHRYPLKISEEICYLN